MDVWQRSREQHSSLSTIFRPEIAEIVIFGPIGGIMVPEL